jgi:tetratricopeptide (TPR) repeat protein
MNTLYDLLGVRPDADDETLRKAFRQAIKATHPDLHAGDPDALLRFRQIVDANALLRDAKQRATYDWLLQLEGQRFRLRLEYQQRQLKLEREQLRLKRMRTTAAVAAVGALAGYGLFASMPYDAIVATEKDKHAMTTGAAVKKDRQPSTVIVAAKENENTSTAIAVAKADAVKGDNASEPAETAAALLIQPATPPGQGEPRHKDDSAGVPDGVIKPSANTSETNSGDAPAGRELALGPLSNNANFYRDRGITAYRSSDFPQAIINLDLAIGLDPSDAQAYNIRGNAWDELGVFERALSDYDEAIRIDPNNPAVFHDRAIMWQRQGALDRALIDLDRAIRFSFSDANIYCDRGLVWYEKGRHDRAVADFNQAIKLDPTFSATCINRGLILHRNSEFKLALADGSKTVRVDPSIFDVIRRTNSRP